MAGNDFIVYYMLADDRETGRTYNFGKTSTYKTSEPAKRWGGRRREVYRHYRSPNSAIFASPFLTNIRVVAEQDLPEALKNGSKT